MELSKYNETDAAIFAHAHVSAATQKKYDVDQIGEILDLVYDFYDTLDVEPDAEVDPIAMLSFVNENADDFAAVTRKELEEILTADNDYMESIGLIEPEDESDDDDDDTVDVDDIVENVYPLLPADIRAKYDIDEVYAVLCAECDYWNENDDDSEEKRVNYIRENLIEDKISISSADIVTILDAEDEFLNKE